LLNRRDKGEAHRLARRVTRLGVWRVVRHLIQLSIGIRLEPRDVCGWCAVRHFVGRGSALIGQDPTGMPALG
jgi:hypothetical protein